MVWVKKSDDFSDECAAVSLSDAAYRTHDEGLLWVMRRETGARFPKRELRRFAETADPETAVRELIDCGFWRDHGDSYEVVHHMQHQVEPEVIAARRANDAERQRRVRRKLAGLGKSQGDSHRDVQRDSHRDVQRDHPRDPGLDGAGLDGAGKAAPTESETSVTEVVTGCRSCKASTFGGADLCNYCAGRARAAS